MNFTSDNSSEDSYSLIQPETSDNIVDEATTLVNEIRQAQTPEDIGKVAASLFQLIEKIRAAGKQESTKSLVLEAISLIPNPYIGAILKSRFLYGYSILLISNITSNNLQPQFAKYLEELEFDLTYKWVEAIHGKALLSFILELKQRDPKLSVMQNDDQYFLENKDSRAMLEWVLNKLRENKIGVHSNIILEGRVIRASVESKGRIDKDSCIFITDLLEGHTSVETTNGLFATLTALGLYGTVVPTYDRWVSRQMNENSSAHIEAEA